MTAPPVPDTIPEWVATTPPLTADPDAPPPGMPDLWPEDVLTEDEWEAAWADRRAIGTRWQT